MSAEKTEILEMYDELTATFSRLDLANFRKFFHLPVQLTTADGVVAISDEKSFESMFGGIMDALREQGFTHSVLAESNIAIHGEGLAMASMLWLRYAGESVLEHLCATYTLIKTGARWEISALLAHPPESVLKIDTA